MPKKSSVAIGVPFYGAQEAQWWANLASHCAVLHKQDIEFAGLLVSGSMATDHNRNAIVHDFLHNTKAEWLFWIDADTIVPIGAIRRLLNIGKTLVGGLYYGKGGEHPPIAYIRMPDGAYKPIDQLMTWERGEIVPVDAMGMGCMLTHRSVYEDIQREFVPLQRYGGGLTLVHKDDIRGEVDQKHHNTDGTVRKGQLRVRVQTPTLKDMKYPFFVLEFGRTEDMFFFENAARVGHKPWLDTSIECGHLRPEAFTGRDYRAFMGVNYG